MAFFTAADFRNSARITRKNIRAKHGLSSIKRARRRPQSVISYENRSGPSLPPARARFGHFTHVTLSFLRFIVVKKLFQIFLTVEPAYDFDIAFLQQFVELARDLPGSQHEVGTQQELFLI